MANRRLPGYLPIVVASGLLLALPASPAAGQGTLDQELRALDNLRNGDQTPLDEVDRQGEALLKQYERPGDRARIHYQIAHVHAQSGLKRPRRVIECARAALDSKLLTPEQRGMLYSYICSAHEVDPEVKDFAERRRRALAPLLEGLAELKAFALPAVAPEFPEFPAVRIEGADPAEAAQARLQIEAARRARREAERTRDLVQRRDTLSNQVTSLYYREPADDDELRKLAAKAVGEKLADKLVAAAKAERERIEKARKEREAQSKPK